jgi:hypothetical protein
MKETTAYRSEYLVVECPYCGEKHYLDVADDVAEGRLPENGCKMDCQKCRYFCTVVDI